MGIVFVNRPAYGQTNDRTGDYSLLTLTFSEVFAAAARWCQESAEGANM